MLLELRATKDISQSLKAKKSVSLPLSVLIMYKEMLVWKYYHVYLFCPIHFQKIERDICSITPKSLFVQMLGRCQNSYMLCQIELYDLIIIL